MTIRLPWMRLAAAQQGGEYLAMFSYFRLKGLGGMPKFLWNSLRIERQLLRPEGLVGHSSGARLGSFEFWSTTVWEDERALENSSAPSPIAGSWKP